MVFLSMVRPTSSPDVRLAHADSGAVATLHPDEAAADVCTQCSETPWINTPEHFLAFLQPFSPTCRICRLLHIYMPLCRESASTRMFLSSVPVPEAIGKLLDEDRFHPRAFEVLNLPKNCPHDDFIILVSDLSHEQPHLALQLPSISPVMSLSGIGDHFRDCISNHGDTCALQENRIPLHLKVIDCKTRTVVDAPAGCNFVALSYVWGKACADQEPDITQDVPLTVEHSIYVTVELGFRYLWIDRYVSVVICPTTSATKRS
jgi:hypothetical protein